MAAPARDKYYLRTVHEEIGLFDRKIAHLQKYDTFASDSERDAAVTKLNTKRESLIKTARLLIEEGVEYRPNDVPKSLRPEDAQLDEPETEAKAPEKASVAAPSPSPSKAVAMHDGSILNFRNEVQEYMQKRRKAYATEAS